MVVIFVLFHYFIRLLLYSIVLSLFCCYCDTVIIVGYYNRIFTSFIFSIDMLIIC